MKLEARNRLMAAAAITASTQLEAATGKEAIKFLKGVFAKHGLKPKLYLETAPSGTSLSGRSIGAMQDIVYTEPTRYGEITLNFSLQGQAGKKTSILLEPVLLGPFGLESLYDLEHFDKAMKVGKGGLRQFGKAAKKFAKDANEVRDQLVFCGEWLQKFAAALQEIEAAVSSNKTRVSEDLR